MASVIVTGCGEVKLPPVGEITGVAEFEHGQVIEMIADGKDIF